MNWGKGWVVGGWVGSYGWVPACTGMTDGGAEMTEGARVRRRAGEVRRCDRRCEVGDRGARDLWRSLVASHPPPNPPLKGGRDELGKGWVVCAVGDSCLRRNDGWERRDDGEGAGATKGGRGAQV